MILILYILFLNLNSYKGFFAKLSIFLQNAVKSTFLSKSDCSFFWQDCQFFFETPLNQRFKITLKIDNLTILTSQTFHHAHHSVPYVLWGCGGKWRLWSQNQNWQSDFGEKWPQWYHHSVLVNFTNCQLLSKTAPILTMGAHKRWCTKIDKHFWKIDNLVNFKSAINAGAKGFFWKHEQLVVQNWQSGCSKLTIWLSKIDKITLRPGVSTF